MNEYTVIWMGIQINTPLVAGIGPFNEVCFILDPKSRHISCFRIFHFDLKPAQIFENVPSPVFTKSFTNIDKIVYWY